MNTRQRTVASLLAVGMLLLTGCAPIGTSQTYRGKKLPNNQTALIKLGHGRHTFATVDGTRIWAQQDLKALNVRRRKWVRVLPGTHDVEVWNRYSSDKGEHVIFDAEAGETYTVHWDIVEEVDYIWVEDKSRSVVWGEKPPKK